MKFNIKFFNNIEKEAKITQVSFFENELDGDYAISKLAKSICRMHNAVFSTDGLESIINKGLDKDEKYSFAAGFVANEKLVLFGEKSDVDMKLAKYVVPYE